MLSDTATNDSPSLAEEIVVGAIVLVFGFLGLYLAGILVSGLGLMALEIPGWIWRLVTGNGSSNDWFGVGFAAVYGVGYGWIFWAGRQGGR